MIRFLFLILLTLATSAASAQRERRSFDGDWLFHLGDDKNMSQRAFDDTSWRRLNVPHDWAIEGDFHVSNPSGAGGGALPGGIGWYRKHFMVSRTALGDDRYYLEFDGVYMNSTVYLNGHELGTRPYGYSSFEYDITPYLNFDGENVVAVKVDNSDQPNSRWYSGCGIYRHVWLTRTRPIHVAHWGTYVRTEGSKVLIDVSIDNNTRNSEKLTVLTTLYTMDGYEKASAQSKVKIEKGKTTLCQQEMTVKNPQLWSVDRPYIYWLKTEILDGNKQVDSYVSSTGFRTFKFDAQTGFWLNGKNMKINGVCNHHDLGCLGAAINEDALHRQLKMLKDMGCNAIRCSHNPPAPELLNMCDTMGFIVMDESFDMWRRRKTRNDYARFFDKWHERDLTDLVLRDRNHPSILMWSIGNEVLEQWSSAEADTLTLEQANLILNAGHDASTLAKEGEMSVNSLLTKHLCEIVRRYDTTRPITAGCNEVNPNNHLFKSGALDIIGFNYHHEMIKDVPSNFPNKPFLMTESVSALQTTGNYIMPSDKIYVAPDRWDKAYVDPSYMCSAYDNMHAPWSSTHEETWDVVKHTPYCAGQFIWTGWDYIGEPTPYSYPARSSYFGIIDLAGFPKDSYYLYQSEWTSKPVLHLFPHWNWVEGQEIDMWCYYNNADEVELYVNGKSQGVRRKADSHQYHVWWRVKFEPGEVRVVARQNGVKVREERLTTASQPHHIRLTTDRSGMRANGRSLAFITAEIVDQYERVCPNAEQEIFFDVNGEGEIAGVDNGLQTSLERFKADKRKTFHGRCLLVMRSSNRAGNIFVTAKAAGLGAGTLKIVNK